ncbi:MAG: SusC/RagA family TonB-linked outer membrane protein [Ekhidna sp.]|nr:SusC/RagA family TonB-linked outer membrane protein [Ekhidna sp.]
MYRYFIFSLLSFSLVCITNAQRTVSGTISDEETGDGLPGVTIQIKGSTDGTISDINGSFSLSAVAEDILVISYVGYSTREITVGERTTINVALLSDAKLLEEVVVTAFGIAQEKRTLNYTVQAVNGDDLVETQQQNLVNSLQGKVAGVQVSPNSGSPGAASTIVVRGGSSISRDNQPLFIIDGIIMNNSSSLGSGNAVQDLNPNDIASVTVLKGPSAAALYGIGGGNGAVIITTRSGESGKVQVRLSSTVAFDRPLAPREVQTTYGRVPLQESSFASWGPAYIPGDTIYDNIEAFFQTGVQQKYDLGISGGNEQSTFYVSLSNNHQTGIVPKESFNRFNALFKASTKLLSNLKVSFNSNLIITDNERLRGGLGGGGAGNRQVGSLRRLFTWPTDDDITRPSYPGQAELNLQNPFWRVNNNMPRYETERIISQVFVEWDILKNLKATYRFGGDFRDLYFRSPIVQDTPGDSDGRITESERALNRLTSTLNLTYSESFGDWNLYALLGNDVSTLDVRQTTFRGVSFELDNFVSINNFSPSGTNVTQNNATRRVVGIYSDIRLDYKGIASVGVTGRQDWSSTLIRNNPFFYPSVNLGFVFTEVLPSGSFTDVLSYGKFRASYAESAQDVAAEVTGNPELETFQGQGGGFNYAAIVGNPNLLPEFFIAKEIGLELKFFKGNLGIDINRYEITTEDQIIRPRLSPASGFIIQTINAGDVVNKGWEVIFDQKVINNSGFKWSTGLAFSKNTSRVAALPEFTAQIPVTNGQVIPSAIPFAVLDKPLFAISGSQYLRTRKGELVLDEDGFPRSGTYVFDEDGNYILDDDGNREISSERVFLGNREPDWLLGITNTIDIKDFTLSFLVDIRKGGDLINAAAANQFEQGTHVLLEKWRNRQYQFNGVIETPDGFAPSDRVVILDENYWRSRHTLVGENFVEDGSFIRLRYVALTYRPRRLAEKLSLQSLSLSATVRNPLLFTRYSGGDPERDFDGPASTGAATVGLDYFSVPNTQGITFGLNMTF